MLAAAIAAAASGCGSAGGGDPAETGPLAVQTMLDERGIVRSVGDGDTLTLRDGRKVRLVQIDAPELAADCWGGPARRQLALLAPPGGPVTLVSDPALDARDRFGRLLRYVFANRVNVNLELVRRGAAAPYFFRNERGRFAGRLLAAAREARAARRGFWGSCPAARLDTGIGSVTGPR